MVEKEEGRGFKRRRMKDSKPAIEASKKPQSVMKPVTHHFIISDEEVHERTGFRTLEMLLEVKLLFEEYSMIS